MPTTDDVIAVLRQVLEEWGPEQSCVKHFALSSLAQGCPVLAPEAVRWCLFGILHKMAHQHSPQQRFDLMAMEKEAVQDTLSLKLGRPAEAKDLADYHDRYGHEASRALIVATIARLEQEKEYADCD